MTNKLFKSFFAVALLLGSALGFVACEEKGDDLVGNPTVEVSVSTLNFTNQEGSQTVDVTSNAEWKVENGADWVTVTPTDGKGDATITIAVAMNDTGAIREAVIKVHAQHPDYGNFDTKKITVSQSATEEPTVEEVLLYGDNFDGEEATKTYGSGSSWPYIDQFPQFANPEGPAAESVTYTGSGVSVRANSTSNSNYSDYAGSGLNNIFFGANAYFQVNGITLDAAQASYKLTFGSEKYSMDGDSIFKNSEFHVMLSMDGYGWSEIEYTFAGTEGGRWNVATAEFTLTEVPETLYIKFNANVASVYRLDDVKLFAGNGGQQVTLTPGEAPEPSEEGTIAAAIEAADGTSVKVNEATVIAIYNRGFLMEDATGKLLVYTNATATVTVGTKVSVEGTVTTYGGFKQFAAVKDSNDAYGPAPEVTVIADGSFTQPTPETLDGAAMDAYLLSPAIKYVEYTGVLTISGSYYNVTVPGAQTAVGSISYPIEGSVDAADGQEIVVRGYTIGVSSSKYVNTMLVECTAKGEAPEVEIKKVTIAEFLAAAEDATIYELTGEITSVTNETYGNFYLNDGTGEVLIYGLCSPTGEAKYWAASGAKVGDTITVQTVRTSYNGTPQGKNAIFVSLVPGDTTPEPEPTPGDVVTIASVLALGDGATINGTIEATVISNYELNNLTSKKGMYVQDETGALQFYLAANHEFAFGTKVKIDLTDAKLGSYNGAVQVSGLALDKITIVSTGNTVTAKTVSMADFLANKYEGQYIALDGVQVVDADLSKTWVMDGKHTSITMEDANGNNFVVFSSKYATYGNKTVAQGSGTVKGISSINNGNMQIIFTQDSDCFDLNDQRFGGDGGEEPEPENPVTPEGYAGRDDFNTVDWNSSYTARQSTAGWVGENCAVQSGGANDVNPVFNSLLGADENTRAWVINGKTSAVGKITSPVISTGCGTLTFNYGIAFSEKNGYDFKVDIVQNSEVVKTFNVVNADNTKFGKFTFSEEVNVTGDFQIVITNNCPSATDGNKDRYSIWDIMWTAHN